MGSVLPEALEVLKREYGLSAVRLSPLSGGRVHQTFLAEMAQGPWLVLQKLNNFLGKSPALGDNWLIIQKALEERGGPIMPKLAPTLDGRSLALDEAGDAWRLSEFLPLRAVTDKGPQTAFEAARLLSAAHKSLNIPSPLHLKPLPPGEFTNHHLCRAEEFQVVFKIYRGHPHLEEIASLLEKAQREALLLPLRPSFLNAFSLGPVIVHGDPKIDNFMADEKGHVAAILDWDTARFAHPLLDVGEMGRSFAVLKDSQGGALFSAEILEALVSGYQEGGFGLTSSDLELLPAVIRALALNLARRYLIDSLAELYFKWDAERYPSLFVQNKSRAEALLDLAAELLERDFELSQRCLALMKP